MADRDPWEVEQDPWEQATPPQKQVGEPEAYFDPEAMAAGALQGAAFEGLDEIGGFAGAAADVLTGKGPLINAPAYYQSNRDRLRSYFDKQRQRAPGNYFLGNVSGAIVPTSKVLNGIGAGRRAKAAADSERLLGEAQNAMTVQDSVSLARQAEKAERKAAGLGTFGKGVRDSALQGYGASDSETVAGDLANAGTAGVIGGAISKATAGADLNAVRSRANEKALKASGAMTKEFRHLSKRGFADDTGRWINENIIDSPFMSLEQIKDRAAGHKESAGVVIGNIVDGADRLRDQAKQVIKDRVLSKPGMAAEGQLEGASRAIDDAIDREYGFSMANVAARIRGLAARDRKVAASRFHEEKLNTLAAIFDDIGGASGSETLRTGLRNKTEQRRLLRDVEGLGEEYKQEVYDIISDELEKSVGKFDHLSETMAKYTTDPVADTVAKNSTRPALPVGDAIGLPTAKPVQDVAQKGRDTAQSFRDANRDYARAATTQKMAENRLGNVQSNRDFGLTTAIAGQTGFLTGGPAGALALGAGNNFLRKYGSSSQAFALHRLALGLEKYPQAFGKYAPMLRTALARGGSSFMLTHYLLSQKDPQYAQFSEQLMREDSP